MSKKRILIAGFGDVGVLLAIHLSKDFAITAISPKPCLVSGQELGSRLTQPQRWQRNYLMDFQRYPHLQGVDIVQGKVVAIDAASNQVEYQLPDGSAQQRHYDVLVIASGTQNGFWRTNTIESKDAIESAIAAQQQQIATANSIAVIGGGPTGVSSAFNMATRFADKKVQLYFSQDMPLPGYHPKVRQTILARLQSAGVEVFPGYRAIIPPGFQGERMTTEPVNWSTGQPSVSADLVLWAVGKVRPNNAFIPQEMLNEQGFVRVNEQLQVPGYENVFALGDIAATDPQRSSARNWGFRVLAHNITRYLNGQPQKMKAFKPPKYRWGSILGVQTNGMEVFQANGGRFRFPGWSIDRILFPFFVHRMIYKGVKSG